jgi:hypothetical protein
MPPTARYVGRPGPWGNPFTHVFLSLAMSLALYREAVTGGWNPAIVKTLTDKQVHIVYMTAERWKKQLREKVGQYAYHQLTGFDLACWCPLDQPCHADVLLEIANA